MPGRYWRGVRCTCATAGSASLTAARCVLTVIACVCVWFPHCTALFRYTCVALLLCDLMCGARMRCASARSLQCTCTHSNSNADVRQRALARLLRNVRRCARAQADINKRLNIHAAREKERAWFDSHGEYAHVRPALPPRALSPKTMASRLCVPTCAHEAHGVCNRACFTTV
jgi:hypothetical protein